MAILSKMMRDLVSLWFLSRASVLSNKPVDCKNNRRQRRLHGTRLLHKPNVPRLCKTVAVMGMLSMSKL